MKINREGLIKDLEGVINFDLVSDSMSDKMVVLYAINVMTTSIEDTLQIANAIINNVSL